MANLIVTAGADRILTLDLHAPAIEGFFDIPVDHLRATPLLAARIKQTGDTDIVAVSPDAGGVARADNFRARLRAPLAIISKRHPDADATEVLEMVGDVEGKTCVIVDDMISTGGTLVAAAKMLHERGARKIVTAATHGIFANDALRIIEDSVIEKVYVTDSLPLPEGEMPDYVDIVSIAPMMAEAILRIHKDLSISALFS
jgi:ribose-phosphate pyrophosphokinase